MNLGIFHKKFKKEIKSDSNLIQILIWFIDLPARTNLVIPSIQTLSISKFTIYVSSAWIRYKNSNSIHLYFSTYFISIQIHNRRQCSAELRKKYQIRRKKSIWQSKFSVPRANSRTHSNGLMYENCTVTNTKQLSFWTWIQSLDTVHCVS